MIFKLMTISWELVKRPETEFGVCRSTKAENKWRKAEDTKVPPMILMTIFWEFAKRPETES